MSRPYVVAVLFVDYCVAALPEPTRMIGCFSSDENMTAYGRAVVRASLDGVPPDSWKHVGDEWETDGPDGSVYVIQELPLEPLPTPPPRVGRRPAHDI